MIPSPILKVLSTIQRHQCRALLMGGQACVIYGSAEFSRDVDFAVLANENNLTKLSAALAELQADVIAVPPFERKYLEEGLAVHFRCNHPAAANLRVDIMSRMRGVQDFEHLWNRRTSVVLADGTQLDILSLLDLVHAKKTQRDKDWPMIARLIDVHYQLHHEQPSPDEIHFWLTEMRSADRLIEVAKCFVEKAEEISVLRPAVRFALNNQRDQVANALKEEELREREADRQYWAPLRARLEQLRRDRLSG